MGWSAVTQCRKVGVYTFNGGRDSLESIAGDAFAIGATKDWNDVSGEGSAVDSEAVRGVSPLQTARAYVKSSACTVRDSDSFSGV